MKAYKGVAKRRNLLKAFKGFDKRLRCRGFQYEVGKEYQEPEASLCRNGFHACENPLDSPSPQASTYITGFIPVHSGDTVRFEGMNLKEGSAAINEQRIAFYDANKAVIAAPYWKDTGTNTMSGGYLASLTVPAYSGKTVAFARFGCYWIDSHSIITVNEEIG